MEEEKKEAVKEGNRKEKKKGKKWLWILAIVAVLVVGFLVYSVFSGKTCSDISCFNSAMAKCQKVNFINEAEDASWLYTISGKEGSFGCFMINSKCSSCNINVKLLQVKKGTVETSAIEGLDMNCNLALGYVGIPNSDLTKCHGDLREGLQDLMIKKMHAYILSNVGQIGEQLTGI